MRPLSPDIAALVRPMPKDFDPPFEDKGNHIRWSDVLEAGETGPMRVELGFSLAQGRADVVKQKESLRESVWQATELARIGRRDMLQYAAVDRHKIRIPRQA